MASAGKARRGHDSLRFLILPSAGRPAVTGQGSLHCAQQSSKKFLPGYPYGG